MAIIIENWPELALACVLIAISGLVSASETALFALTRQELASLRQSRTVAAQAVVLLRGDPRALLSTVLLLNTGVNILLYSILGVLTVKQADGSAAVASVLGVAAFVVTVFLAEVFPKQLALVMSMRLSLIVALPLRLVQAATAIPRLAMETVFVEPLTRVLSGTHGRGAQVSPQELQDMVNVCQAEGLIDDRENALLHQVMGLAETRVSALMVPRVDFAAFKLAGDRQQLVDLIRSRRLHRIPVYEESIDHVKGVILAKEFLLNPEKPLDDLIRPVHYIPEQARVEALLLHFRATGSQWALVVDEYGGLAGVIALEDVVEAVVGDLRAPDEVSVEPKLQRLGDASFLIDAGLDVDDFRRAFRLAEEHTRIDTVGGLILENLGRLPVVGDEVMIGEVKLSVVAVKKRRILQAKVELKSPPAANPTLSVLLGTSPGSRHRRRPASNGAG